MKKLIVTGFLVLSASAIASVPEVTVTYRFDISVTNTATSDQIKDSKGNFHYFNCTGRTVDLPLQDEKRNYIEFDNFTDCSNTKLAILSATNENPVEVEVAKEKIIRITVLKH